jgi:hypothetical protein
LGIKVFGRKASKELKKLAGVRLSNLQLFFSLK